MFKILLILGVVAQSLAQDCWTTGCQKDSWAVKGCQQYDRVEKARERCWADGEQGYKYTCCKGGDNGDGGGGGGDKGSARDITWDQFSRAVTSNPDGENWRWPQPTRDQYDTFMRSITPKGDIRTKEEAAMALANLLQESDGLKAKREYACENSGCPGHYQTANCDVQGQYYYGRGYIQLTWCYNYRDASNGLFGDQRLVHDPDSVARSEQLAWDTAFWYWKVNVHSKPGVQEGRFGATIRAINGGQECGGSAPHPEKAERRKRIYKAVRRAFSLQGDGDLTGC